MDGKLPAQINKRTNANGVKFLSALRDCPNISYACREVGISRGLAYTWRDDAGYMVDEGDGPKRFGDLMKEALEDGVDNVEVQAIRWAKGELLEVVLYKGQPSWETETDDERLLDGKFLTIVTEDGTRRVKIDDQGRPVPLMVHTRNARMIELVLKARKKAEYGDKLDIQADLNHSGGVVILPGMATDIEAFNRLADEHQRRFREEHPEQGTK